MIEGSRWHVWILACCFYPVGAIHSNRERTEAGSCGLRPFMDGMRVQGNSALPDCFSRCFPRTQHFTFERNTGADGGLPINVGRTESVRSGIQLEEPDRFAKHVVAAWRRSGTDRLVVFRTHLPGPFRSGYPTPTIRMGFSSARSASFWRFAISGPRSNRSSRNCWWGHARLGSAVCWCWERRWCNLRWRIIWRFA